MARPPSRDRRDLFSEHADREKARRAPLAARMRPRTLDEIVGQDHLIGPGQILRRLIESDQVPSMVLWGPPGAGKTTLAGVIARQTQSHFEPVSAVTSGVTDLRRVITEAEERHRLHQQRTILFIDEIHRFNKAQQDVVLPYVEDGTITLIGATTENPSFEVIGPLLSRTRVFRLHALSEPDLETVIRRAIADRARGLGEIALEVSDAAIAALARASGGDARTALNALELATTAAPCDEDGVRRLGLAAIEEALQHRAPLYDKAGDAHYDTISAFIKSLRGSDPDAALYWLTRMVEAGEDPLFIVRRMVILAAEDVGLADPMALVVATACQQAVHFVGLPEAYIPMAECAIYLATAPKSNTTIASRGKLLADVRRTRNDPVPLHLRNAVTALMKDLGYGRDYKYAHRYEGHYVEQQYLPDRLAGQRYYEPSDQGFEATIAERLARRRSGAERSGPPPKAAPSGEQDPASA
jgi:putative ATPase